MLLGRKGREASQAFGTKVNKHLLGLVSHLTTVATIQLHYCSLQEAVDNT